MVLCVYGSKVVAVTQTNNENKIKTMNEPGVAVHTCTREKRQEDLEFKGSLRYTLRPRSNTKQTQYNQELVALKQT